MKLPKFIRHVTLQTGDSRDSYRAEVGDDAVANCRELLDRAIATERTPVPIPGFEAYKFRVDAAVDGGWVGSVWGDGVCLVIFGMCLKSRGAAGMWKRLNKIACLSEPVPRPQGPWLAMTLGLGLYRSPAMSWLGDFLRCIAWAWIERQAEH